MKRSAFLVGFFGTLLVVTVVMLVLTWTWAFGYPPEAGLGVPDESPSMSEPNGPYTPEASTPSVFPWKSISELQNDKDTYGFSGEQECKVLTPDSDVGVKVTVTFIVNRVELLRKNGEHWVKWQHAGDGPFAAVLLGEDKPVLLVRGVHLGDHIIVTAIEGYDDARHGNTCALIAMPGNWQEVK